ncbi:MAG TPA: DUF3300 domain-containing protein, partial [Anaeromyxobacteraceae bacterium]|nr:DUF3300 domain-containing protein [Anaeromyxobacteraceae bacterium]
APKGVHMSRRIVTLATAAFFVAAPMRPLAQGTGGAPSGASTPADAGATPEKKLPPEQIDALVAPIALYPDPLLSQALMASTYPLEIIQAQQWLAKNAKLSGDALEKAVQAQPWDPSVQATVMVPDLLKRLGEDITWTTNLGNAFLAQEKDVMDAVQRLRKKAQAAGKLESNDKMKVETQTVEQQQVVVIQPASPQVVYVPAYNPTVIWGPPPVYYPYPPVYYPPPPPPGAMLFSFSMGVMMGAAFHGGYCCGCGWGHSNTVVINNNNTFVNNYNRTNNISNTSGNSNWQHNSQHRGGAPYGDKATANKYGGGQRGGAQARPTASTMDRGGGAGGMGGAGGSRGGPSAGTMDRGGSAGGSRGGASASSWDRGGGSAGNRSVSPSAGGSAFGGSGGGASRAQASSSRGASSMQARPSGGGSRGGGGGRGGGRR